MKFISYAVLAVAAAGLPFMASANTERPDQKEIPNPETLTMAFDQCVEIIRNYENEMGAPRIVLDTPSLRVVQFTTENEREQVSCDRDEHIMTLLDMDE